VGKWLMALPEQDPLVLKMLQRIPSPTMYKLRSWFHRHIENSWAAFSVRNEETLAQMIGTTTTHSNQSDLAQMGATINNMAHAMDQQRQDTNSTLRYMFDNQKEGQVSARLCGLFVRIDCEYFSSRSLVFSFPPSCFSLPDRNGQRCNHYVKRQQRDPSGHAGNAKNYVKDYKETQSGMQEVVLAAFSQSQGQGNPRSQDQGLSSLCAAPSLSGARRHV